MTKPLPFSSEVQPADVILQRPEGGVEFTCTGCGYNVISAIQCDEFAVCMSCRFLGERPQIKWPSETHAVMLVIPPPSKGNSDGST